MIYQHATRGRDQAIVKALGTFVREARDVTGEIANGPERGTRCVRQASPCGTPAIQQPQQGATRHPQIGMCGRSTAAVQIVARQLDRFCLPQLTDAERPVAAPNGGSGAAAVVTRAGM